MPDYSIMQGFGKVAGMVMAVALFVGASYDFG